MSGHSKWSQIKRQKGVTDAKKGTLFTKLGNNITLAARSGGGDPDINFKLRLAMDKAKAAAMTKDTIERAIKRGTGELEGAHIEEVTYEGYGPGGVAILVLVVTDNKNRTASLIRNFFTKHGGNMGGMGAVSWMFQQKGVLRIEKDGIKTSPEEIELAAIDAGAEDVKESAEGIMVICAPADLEKVQKMIEQKGVTVEHAETEYVASTSLEVSDTKAREQLDALYADLENCDDVQNYYTNET